MTSPGSKLNRRQEKALAALLVAPNLDEAAAASGVSKSTLQRWLRQEAFKSEFRQRRLGVLDGVVTRLLALADKALAAWERNVTCGKPSVEVRTADLILSHARLGVEIIDLAQRLDAVEAEILRRNHEQRTPTGESLGGRNGSAAP